MITVKVAWGWYSTAPDLISPAITVNRGGIGVDYHVGQKGAEPNRQTCRQPRAHAPDDAQHEPREARGCPGSHVPTSTEVRERHQPHRRQPPAADFANPSGA